MVIKYPKYKKAYKIADMSYIEIATDDRIKRHLADLATSVHAIINNLDNEAKLEEIKSDMREYLKEMEVPGFFAVVSSISIHN